jgi:hypothetical protein
MMRLTELEPLPLSLIVSLTVAVVLLAIRVFLMQRVQSRRIDVRGQLAGFDGGLLADDAGHPQDQP